jgi:hypothetical protein
LISIRLTERLPAISRDGRRARSGERLPKLTARDSSPHTLRLTRELPAERRSRLIRSSDQTAVSGGSQSSCTSDAGGGYRPRGQARGADRLTAVLASAVSALREPDHRRLDLGKVLLGLADQGRDMLALERERGALGIVLVIAASRTRLDDPRELSPEPAQPLEDACPLRRQQLSYASLLSHHSWIPGGLRGALRGPPGEPGTTSTGTIQMLKPGCDNCHAHYRMRAGYVTTRRMAWTSATSVIHAA